MSSQTNNHAAASVGVGIGTSNNKSHALTGQPPASGSTT